jgi:hypothetical protein
MTDERTFKLRYTITVECEGKMRFYEDGATRQKVEEVESGQQVGDIMCLSNADVTLKAEVIGAFPGEPG